MFVTARKMTDLKVVDVSEQLAPPRQITEATRAVQAAEVADQRLVALPKPPRVPIGQDERLPVGPEAHRATS